MKCRSGTQDTHQRPQYFPTLRKANSRISWTRQQKKRIFIFFSFDFCGKRRSFFDSGFREGNNTCSFSRILEAECPGKKSFTNLAVCASVYLGNRNKQNLTVQFPSFSGKQLCASWHVRRWRRSGHQKFSSLLCIHYEIIQRNSQDVGKDFFWRGLGGELQ